LGTTTDTGEKLQVTGTAKATTLTDGFISISSAQINRSGGNIELQFGGASGVRLFGSGGVPITFLSNGNSIFGSSTDAGFKLDVYGTTRFIGTTASDTAPLGSELAGVTGTGTNWALASGATNLNVGGYVHTVGSTTPLTTSLAAVNGTYYQIAYTITGRTAGSITIAYGGTSTAGITATGNTGPLASSTAVLTITPTTDFNGTVVLSIKTIGTSSASSTFTNSSGTSIVEIRAGSSSSNLFIGLNAGRRNTTGINNTFYGTQAGENTTAGSNAFFGFQAGQTNVTGIENAGFGGSAIGFNTTGSFNTGVGVNALVLNTTGSNNTGIGNKSLFFQSTGSNNIGIGLNAGRQTSGGANNTISDNSILIGVNTTVNAISQTNQIVIGHSSTGLGSNTTVLGNSSTVTTAIYGDLLLGGTTPITSALLAMTSTTEGFLPPRMTTTQKNAIATPATGLVVFDTTLGKLCVFSTTWQTISST
jgi:hypothetical protein